MDTRFHTIDEERELNDRLDQLMPPPLTASRKLVVGSVLLALALAVTVLNANGYLAPKPFAGSSFSSSIHLVTDHDRGLVAARVMIPNTSQRTVRVTAVTLDAPGAELMEVEVVIVAVGETAEFENGETTLAETTLTLPASIGAGQHAFLVLWFRPLQCEDGEPPWGIASATFDFGDGAFPPFPRTLRIDQDPIWDDETQMSIRSGDEFFQGAGPLAAACEALR